MKREDIRFFDQETEYDVVQRALPHWSQAAAVTFVTWRLADSLPKAVLVQLDREIEILLSEDGILRNEWKTQIDALPAKQRSLIQRKLFAVRDKFLDQGFGDCQLANQPCAKIVVKSLQHFDGERYFLSDAVVMPNHVHFLCAFEDETSMLKQCSEWKRYTARKINALLSRTGELWQVDQFDHLIRNDLSFKYYRDYIANNPHKAGLPNNQYLHFQKEM